MNSAERPALEAAMQWNDTKACEHFVQFYEDDAVLIEAVTMFIGASLASGGAGIVVATEQHRAAIETALTVRGFDLAASSRSGHYLALDAAGTLETILFEGWP